jgi:hypothetical protein
MTVVWYGENLRHNESREVRFINICWSVDAYVTQIYQMEMCIPSRVKLAPNSLNLRRRSPHQNQGRKEDFAALTTVIFDGGCCTQIELMGAAGTLNMLGHVIG